MPTTPVMHVNALNASRMSLSTCLSEGAGTEGSSQQNGVMTNPKYVPSMNRKAVSLDRKLMAAAETIQVRMGNG